jgi:hypothetical protein
MNALKSVNNYAIDTKGNLLMKNGTNVLIAFSPYPLTDPPRQSSPGRPPKQSSSTEKKELIREHHEKKDF